MFRDVRFGDKSLRKSAIWRKIALSLYGGVFIFAGLW